MEFTSNINQVLKELEKSHVDVDKAIALATDRVAMLAVGQMKKQIRGVAPREKRNRQRATSKGAKGSSYWHYFTRTDPGNPPHNRTGNLRRSIHASSKKGFDGSYSAIVGPGAVYARALEVTGVGTSGKRYPFVEPTGIIMSKGNRVQEIYIRALRNALD